MIDIMLHMTAFLKMIAILFSVVTMAGLAWLYFKTDKGWDAFPGYIRIMYIITGIASFYVLAMSLFIHVPV